MARIAGVNIPDRTHALIALTSIYGIGRSLAAKICDEANVPSTARMIDLTDEEVERLRAKRTQTNARTRKGPRRPIKR